MDPLRHFSYHSSSTYDRNHVYGAKNNYIHNKSYNILPSKMKPGDWNYSTNKGVPSGTSFNSPAVDKTRNVTAFTSGSRRYSPSPPKQSLTYRDTSYDLVRPAMRAGRPSREHGPATKVKSVQEKYLDSLTKPALAREHLSPLKSRSHQTSSEPTLSRPKPSSLKSPPALPARNSPILHGHVVSKSKEEITIDQSPYTSPYSPSFSKSPSPKRQQEKSDEKLTVSSGPEGNGTVGLKNIGNTCFMNSMLQCLSHTVELRDYCLRSDYLRHLNDRSPMKGKLMKAFAELIRDLWSGGNAPLTPNNFKTQIQRFSPRFVGYEQQDSQEFLRFLLEGLHEDTNQVQKKSSEPLKNMSHLRPQEIARETWKWYGKKDKSFVFDLFVGQLESYLECSECGHVSLTYDPFWDLSLPISKSSYSADSISLYECLRTFTKQEILDRDEKPLCEKCKVRRRMTKKLTIHRFPKILVIHLKRFHEGSRYRQKLSNQVSFPVSESLKFFQFASDTCEDKPSTNYNLYAVSNHCGSCYGGHYTAFCYNNELDRWCEFNDSRVTTINEGSVCTKEAYVLFYVQQSASNRSSRL